MQRFAATPKNDMLLAHPTEGVRRSVKEHNSNITLVADWLELGVLLFDDDDEGITVHECVDYFVEEQIYRDQGFCAAFFESVFGELRTRTQLFGTDYPISIDPSLRLTCAEPWREHTALAFCLLVSTAPFYSGYTDWVGGDYVQQGALFEAITAAALGRWFPEWEVTRTGWGGGIGTPLIELLDEIAASTMETVRTEAPAFVAAAEKDLGMDIAAVRRFPDRRAALPVIFGQCASGRDWKHKLHTPDTSRWKQLLTLTHTPLKAFSLPYRLVDGDYTVRRSQCKGLLLDRVPSIASRSRGALA